MQCWRALAVLDGTQRFRASCGLFADYRGPPGAGRGHPTPNPSTEPPENQTMNDTIPDTRQRSRLVGEIRASDDATGRVVRCAGPGPARSGCPGSTGWAAGRTRRRRRGSARPARPVDARGPGRAPATERRRAGRCAIRSRHGRPGRVRSPCPTRRSTSGRPAGPGPPPSPAHSCRAWRTSPRGRRRWLRTNRGTQD